MHSLARKYRAFYLAVEAFCAEWVANQGHGFDHDTLVAGFAVRIAATPHIAELAWIASHLHSFDRRLPKEEVEKVVRRHIALVPDLSSDDVEWIWEAVRDHSEKNNENDNAVSIALKDADRLANIGPSVIIRGGQFYPNTTTQDFGHLLDFDPASKYNEPKTVLDDLRFCLEWELWLRLPEAQRIAKPFFDFLRAFFEMNAKHVQEAELDG